MRPPKTSRTLGLLACAVVASLPSALAAQRRVSFEPRVSGLPDAAVWGRTTTRREMPSLDPNYPMRFTAARVTELERTPVSLVGGRILIAPVLGAWRVGIDGGIGSGSLRAYVREEASSRSTVPGDTSTCCTGYTSFERTRLPLALAQLGLTADRPTRWKGIGVDLGGGLMAQQLRVRTHTLYVHPFTGAFYNRNRYRTAYDPALQASVAIGPVSGPGAGLRLAFRSTHVWRHARLANEFRVENASPLTDASGRRWQWQPELTVGWQVPVLGRGAAAPAR